MFVTSLIEKRMELSKRDTLKGMRSYVILSFHYFW